MLSYRIRLALPWILRATCTLPIPEIMWSARYPGGVTVTVAGTGTAGAFGDGGPATSAQLNSPQGVAVDTQGNLYIADYGNDAVVEVAGGILTTVFNQQGAGPIAVAVDGTGNLFFAAFGFSVVGDLSTGGTLSPVAGNFTTGYSGDAGSAINAALNGPVDVAVDATGNLYIADYNNDVVREVDVVRYHHHGGGRTLRICR